MLETGSPAPSLPQLPFRFGRVKEAQIWDPWGKGGRARKAKSLGKLLVTMGRRKGLGFEVGDVGISKHGIQCLVQKSYSVNIPNE